MTVALWIPQVAIARGVAISDRPDLWFSGLSRASCDGAG
jgi:hypothetical protein